MQLPSPLHLSFRLTIAHQQHEANQQKRCFHPPASVTIVINTTLILCHPSSTRLTYNPEKMPIVRLQTVNCLVYSWCSAIRLLSYIRTSAKISNLDPKQNNGRNGRYRVYWITDKQLYCYFVFLISRIRYNA